MNKILAKHKTTGEIREFRKIEYFYEKGKYSYLFGEDFDFELSNEQFLSEWEVISDTPDVSKDTSSVDEPKTVCSFCGNGKLPHFDCGVEIDKAMQEMECWQTQTHLRDCKKCNPDTPSSSLEDKIVEKENGLSAFGIQDIKDYEDMYISQGKNEIDKMERRFNIWLENRDDDFELDIWDFRIIQDFINKELSLYKQQLLQEYDNKFRMGYEAGRREVLEECVKEIEKKISTCNMACVGNDSLSGLYVAKDLIKNLNNK